MRRGGTGATAGADAAGLARVPAGGFRRGPGLGVFSGDIYHKRHPMMLPDPHTPYEGLVLADGARLTPAHTGKPDKQPCHCDTPGTHLVSVRCLSAEKYDHGWRSVTRSSGEDHDQRDDHAKHDDDRDDPWH